MDQQCSITWSWLEMHNLGPTPDPLNENLRFNTIPGDSYAH